MFRFMLKLEVVISIPMTLMEPLMKIVRYTIIIYVPNLSKCFSSNF